MVPNRPKLDPPPLQVPNEDVPNAVDVFGSYMRGTNKPQAGWMQACRVCASWTGVDFHAAPGLTCSMCPRCARNWRAGEAGGVNSPLQQPEIQRRLRAVLRELRRHDSPSVPAMILIKAIERQAAPPIDPTDP